MTLNLRRNFLQVGVIVILLFPCLGWAKNLGHRMGAGPGEYHQHLPENSLIALEAALKGTRKVRPLQMDSEFLYLEFDVQETADGELVVFHDQNFDRMLPDNAINKAPLSLILNDVDTQLRIGRRSISHSDLEMRYLTLDQIKTLTLAQSTNQKVPTLDEVLSKCIKWNNKKPIAVDIKYIYSDSAKEKLIETVSHYRDDYSSRIDIIFEKKYDMDKSGTNFLALPSHFSHFGKKWCAFFSKLGFKKIFRAKRHSVDLCQ